MNNSDTADVREELLQLDENGMHSLNNTTTTITTTVDDIIQTTFKVKKKKQQKPRLFLHVG